MPHWVVNEHQSARFSISLFKWGDLSPIDDRDAKYVVAEVHGKTGGREVVCQKDTGKLFNEIINIRCAELKQRYPDDREKWNPHRDGLVFCHPDGTEIKTFKRSFHSLLDFADLPILKNGTARTNYSLRHLPFGSTWLGQRSDLDIGHPQWQTQMMGPARHRPTCLTAIQPLNEH